MKRAIRMMRICALPCAILVAAGPAQAQRYDVTYLEFPYGFSGIEIADINNNGDVVGTGHYRHNTDTVPSLWRDGAWVGLPPFQTEPYGFGWQYHAGSAWGINDSGQVVGQSYVFAGRDWYKAALWPIQGGIVDLFGVNSIARDINNAGVIVGSRSGAFRLENGEVTLLSPMITAVRINNRGQIIGYDHTRAMVWKDGEITILPTSLDEASPNAINDKGVIVGIATNTEHSLSEPVIWKYGSVRAMPYFGIGARPRSINEHEVIAGECVIQQMGIYFGRASIWRHNLVTNLNDLTVDPLPEEWYLGGNTYINDGGQIASAIARFTVGAKPVRLEPVDIGLTLWGIDPSRPGRRNTIEIHHVSPNGRVILLWGTTRGEPQPFQQCSGAMIDLADPHLAAFGVADSNGVARITLNVPANVEGNYIFQAVDHTTCEVSPPAWALFKMVN